MNQLTIKILFLSLITILHKYYVSTTLIDFDEDSNYFEITLKTFYDDLELDLNISDIDYKKDYEKMNKLYERYLIENFQIFSNNQIVNLDYLGFEKKNDQINIYLQFKLKNGRKNFSIRNKILYNSFPKQKNISLEKVLYKILKIRSVELNFNQ